MYHIKTHERINQIIKIFHLFRMWRNEDAFSGFLLTGWKLLYLILELSFALSLISGGLFSDDKSESAYLIAVGTGISVLTVKLYYILWKKEKILAFILEIGSYSVADYDEFVKAHNKIKNLLKLSSSLFLLVFVCSVTILIFSLPIFHSEKMLPFNIWFPMDWKNNTIAYWIAYFFILIGATITYISLLFNAIIWYLMMNCAIKYVMLGNQFRHIGSAKSTIQNRNMSDVEMEMLFLQELIGLVKTHENIQQYFICYILQDIELIHVLLLTRAINRFKSCFANVFFAQILTSAICICGTIYMLSFGTHDGDLTQVGIQFAIINYNIFDIFLVMYLGNEIIMSSDHLSYCLFESNWIERSQSYKKHIIIVTEVFKRPQELLIGKVYPLNLKTFTTIVNSAYSLFNILRNLK